MSDIVSPSTRSRMMANIRSRDTSPELLMRCLLQRRGFRYRLHVRDLPGRPDMVFPARRAVILIHGCFWHGHGCHLFKWPASRQEFWQKKIESNMKRDETSARLLTENGWRILTVWECAIKGRWRMAGEEIEAITAEWLARGSSHLELKGIPRGCAD